VLTTTDVIVTGAISTFFYEMNCHPVQSK
jgi:hypothetical protein